MSFNGSGTFVINTAGQPVVSGTVISSTAFNALTADLATGLSTCITKDGQTTPTANIPMGNNKITGLAVGTAATDAANLSQVQSTTAKLINSISGTDTITGTMSPTLGAYATGQMFYFVAAGDNTGAVTLNIDSLGAKSVTRDGSVALAAGDIKSGEVVVVVYDGTRFQVVSQLNSAGNATFANVSIASALNVGGVATFTGGTANGVTYLNGSKVLTSGTALTFDGTNLGIGTSSPASILHAQGNSAQFNLIAASGNPSIRIGDSATSGTRKEFTITVDNTNNRVEMQAIQQGVGVRDIVINPAGGNLGLGVTPSAWNSAYKSFDIATGGGGSLFAGAGFAGLYTNAFVNTSGQEIYKANGFANQYVQVSGSHRWYNAPSGTAGNTITFTQAMTLDASGNLGVGTTSPGNRLNITAGNGNQLILDNTGQRYTQVDFRNNTTQRGVIYFDETDDVFTLQANTGCAITFNTNGASERARITGAEGDLLVGTSTRSGGKITALQSGAADTTFDYASSGSYANIVNIAACNRSANSAYSLFYGISNRPAINDGTGQDIEFNLRGDGNGYADGTWNNNGADYAEYFESATGGALTVGATVVLEGNKVREATASDPASAIMGVVRPKEPSKASMVVGNTAWNKWANKYLTDDFDRYIMEDHDVVEWTDEDGKQHSYESHNIPAGVTVPANAVRKTHDEKGNKFQHYKLNPAWDKDAEYTPREKRDEWIIVGLVGQVKVLKGKPVNDRWIKMRDVSAAVEEWMIR